LTHFAAAIFWKAAAREWRVPNNRLQLEFGPYKERLRRFLRAEGAFPDEACLVIAVSGNTNPFLGACYPYDFGRSSGAREFRFSIPGLSFWLYHGKIRSELKQYCAVGQGRLCLSPDLNNFHMGMALPDIIRSKPPKSFR
jgi:hypothetical protein